MPTKMTLKELKDGDEVHFIPTTPAYGVAEYTFCPVYRGGKLHEVYIHPQQQPGDIDCYYVIKAGSADSLSVMSWTHKGIGLPMVWLHGWCKKHNCSFFRLYVPKNSNFFSVSTGSDVRIYFSYTPPNL